MVARNLSYSQLKTWLECRQAWAYRYRDGHKAKKAKTDFMRGSLVHLGMEHLVIPNAYPTAQHGWDAALTKWHEEWAVNSKEWIGYAEFVAGCRAIVEGGVEEFRVHWRVVEDAVGPLLERRFYAALPGWKGLVYIPDAVAERLTGPYTGGKFVVDFKSFGKAKDADAADMDLQGIIYQRCLQEEGIPVIGSALFQLAGSFPREPRINKDGSTHKGDDAAVARWKPVAGELLALRSRETLDTVWDTIVLPAAAEIAAQLATGAEAYIADAPPIVPNLAYYACRFCEFKGPCHARLKGHDEAAILASEFTRRA